MKKHKNYKIKQLNSGKLPLDYAYKCYLKGYCVNIADGKVTKIYKGK